MQIFSFFFTVLGKLYFQTIFNLFHRRANERMIFEQTGLCNEPIPRHGCIFLDIESRHAECSFYRSKSHGTGPDITRTRHAISPAVVRRKRRLHNQWTSITRDGIEAHGFTLFHLVTMYLALTSVRERFVRCRVIPGSTLNTRRDGSVRNFSSRDARQTLFSYSQFLPVLRRNWRRSFRLNYARLCIQCRPSASLSSRPVITFIDCAHVFTWPFWFHRVVRLSTCLMGVLDTLCRTPMERAIQF